MSAAGESRAPAILVVEDDPFVSMTVCDALTQLGCAVVGPAARLEQALTVARDDRIDGAVLDVNLAGAPVYPVADVLLARGIRFIFLTAYGSPVLPERFRACRTLTKPVPDDRLRAIVQTDLLSVARRAGGA